MNIQNKGSGCQENFRRRFFKFLSDQQTWVTRLLASRGGGKRGHGSLASSRGSGFQNFQRVSGLGDQGAELGILRRWDLRRWAGKMRPTGFGGKMLFPSWPVCSRPRLPALTTLVPEPRRGGERRANARRNGPGNNHTKRHPACLQHKKHSFPLDFHPSSTDNSYV